MCKNVPWDLCHKHPAAAQLEGHASCSFVFLVFQVFSEDALSRISMTRKALSSVQIKLRASHSKFRPNCPPCESEVVAK